jgi:hypothetical protein
MKTPLNYIGIVLISFVNVCNASIISNEIVLSDFEPFENVIKTNVQKTPEELIAEDNAITENNISNDVQKLDFNYINIFSNLNEIIEFVNYLDINKTPEELIAEDNAITENNISNKTHSLDYERINSH